MAPRKTNLNPDGKGNNNKTKPKSSAMQRGPGQRGKPKAAVAREKRNDNLDLTGPAGLAGIAGLRRVAAKGGFFPRMRNSDIRDMRIRETDAYRRLEAHNQGRLAAKLTAQNATVARTGVGVSPGYNADIARQTGKRVRGYSTDSFPKGEPSGQRPIPFKSPGNLAQANAAGKGAIKAGVPRTTPPGGRPSTTPTTKGRVPRFGSGGGLRIGLRRGIGER